MPGQPAQVGENLLGKEVRCKSDFQPGHGAYPVNRTIFMPNGYVPGGSHQTLARYKMITSAEEFIHLRESTNPEEYSRAVHEEAPVQIWKDILNRFPEMRFWVAQNKTVPIEILKILSMDENPDVRSMVSMKRNLNREIKEILIKDSDPSVRNQLASNTKLEDEFLQILSNDPESFVRETALRKLKK